LAAAGARVVDRELPVPAAAEAFTGDGALADAGARVQLTEVLTDLLADAAIDRAVAHA